MSREKLLVYSKRSRKISIRKPAARSERGNSEGLHVDGFDFNGWRNQFVFKGMWARVVQHELDHLEGILICDHGRNLYTGKNLKNGK